jgi:hypothetical protein
VKHVIQPGGTIDTLTQGELHTELASVSQEFFRQFGRGVKYLRFGPLATPIASNAFTIDGSTAALGPRSGFCWTIRRITVWGLATGSSPDLANLYRNQNTGIPVWQFNGNNFAYTFGKLEMLLLPGETLSLVSSGTITATGQVSISGDLLEVAAEEVSKIA